jgi:Protein of unknown function (DUF3455)
MKTLTTTCITAGVTTQFASAICAATLLAACASSPSMKTFNQSSLPAAVQVPAGHSVFLETVGVGDITYECRAKAATATVAAGQFEWVFAGPDAKLHDRNGKSVGTYYGPPATWAGPDGVKLTGAQVAVAPAAPGSIPLQLVKANAASGAGMLTGTAYIQRVATQGGVAPTSACAQGNVGAKQVVKYQADYIFWRTGS